MSAILALTLLAAQAAAGVPATSRMAILAAPSLPTDRLHFGIQSVPSQTPDDLQWMISSGVPWKYRYTYLAGGVNTGQGWETWNSPAGAYALNYMSSSTTSPANYFPVLTYYEICQSNGSLGPNPCYGNDPTVDWTNINSAATMAAYYANFKLLMQQAAAYGKPVMVQVEPDFWAFMQQRAATSGFTQASQLTAQVQSSGFADVAGYADNLQGFACGLLHLRDLYGGGNVIMATHASLWATGTDVGSDTSTTLNAAAEADKTAAFLNSACLSSNPYGGSTWDAVFNDVADHDAGWFELNGSPNNWWDKNNVKFPNFSRYLSWVSEMHTQTARPQIVWQVPIGNQYFLTMNNTCGHYQDNRAEYFLGHTSSLTAAGIVAVLFGSGNSCQTNNFDHDPTDGITNNNGVPTTDVLGGCNACNTHTSTVADNDGGYLRMAVGQYYAAAPPPPPPPPPPTAVRYAGINAPPSIRSWRYLGANPDGWYCVVPNCYQNADPMVTINAELALAHTLGVGNVRVDFPWYLMEPTAKGTYDWTRADAIVAAANAHGVQLQGVIGYTPAWAGSDPTQAPNAQDYYDFVHAVVNRYKSSVHIWEMWNEPDGTHYWNSTQAAFVSNVEIPGYNAAKAADPSSKVMLTGPACATCGWIDGIYSLGGGNYFDIASVHDYNSDPVGAALFTHNSLVANGQGNKPIWLSEYGVSENSVSDTQQQAMINLGLTEAGYPVVAQWYNLRDDNSMTCCPPAVAVAAYWGVVQHDDATLKNGFTTMQTLIGGNPPSLTAAVAQAPLGALGVNFTGTASGGSSPYWYYWDFGDGTSSNQQSPSHTYTGSGTYSVALTVVDAVGRGVTTTTTVTLTGVTTPLTATASAHPAAGDVPAVVNFAGVASGGVAPYTYAWTFGDGASGSGASPSHTYSAAGTYTATLTVTDAGSHTATAQATVVVSPTLSVSIGASPLVVDVGDSVSFSSTPVGGLAPFSYSWSFGDGASSTAQNPSHAYSSSAMFTASVTVTDANAVRTSAIVVVTVHSPLSATASANPNAGDAPVTTTLSATGSGGTTPYTYTWNFGDGTAASTSQSPSHTYSSAGTYRATVTVTDALGHSVTSTATMTVSPALSAAAGATPTSGSAPLTVNLSGTPTGGKAPYTYSWNFGDGTSASTAQNPSHGYANAGSYTATVTVTDANGVTVSASAPSITVTPTVLTVSASGAPTAGDAPVTVALSASGSGGTAPVAYAWTFGDGTTGTGATPSHKYTSAGTYTATVTASDAGSQKATATVTITVAPALTLGVSATPTSVDAGDAVSLTGTPGGGLTPYTYSWNFGDGSAASTAQNPTHAYTTTGAYIATLTVTDANGVKKAATVQVTVNAAPTVTATASPASGDAPVNVNLTATPVGGTQPYSFSWNFGDGSAASTAQNPSHSYSSAGTYTATVTLTDGTGHSVTASSVITVSPALGATASASPTSGQAPLTVNLTATPNGGKSPYSYSWNFGDGGATSTSQNPSHLYASAGTYTASVTVRDANGSSVTTNAPPVTVTIAPLVATATGTPTSGDAPLSVNFKASGVGGMAPLTYSWAFGDGTTATGINPTHLYSTAGTYTVTLTVTDATTQRATAQVTVVVSPALSITAAGSPPVVDAGDSIGFSSTPTGGLTPYSYSWNFGDGGSSTAQNPSHAYSSAGSFTATVTLTDANGVKAPASVLVTVHSRPAVTATASPNAGDAPVVTTLSASASGGTGPYGYSWNFGDGSVASTTQNPSHVYSSAGTYNAAVTLTDGVGHSVTSTATVTVAPALGATAGANPTSGQAPMSVNFTSMPTGGQAPYTYSWSFGDGTAASTTQNPSHTYSGPGTFNAKVTITDAFGATATASAPAITVTPAPLTVSANASPTTGDAPLTTALSASVSGGTSPYVYAWDLGDGSTSAQQSFNHSYGAGSYTVTLTITDGAYKTAKTTIHVTVYTGLSVNTTATPTSGTAPLGVSFTASVTGGLAPYTYTWAFGDGTTGSSSNVSHTYRAGQFNATLTVHDSAGGAWSGSVGAINASAPPSSNNGGASGPPPSTGGTQPPAQPASTPTPTASPTASPTPSPSPTPTSNGVTTSSSTPGSTGNAGGLLMLIGAIFASGLGGLLFVAWRRRRFGA